MRPLLVLAHGTRSSKAQWAQYGDLLTDAELHAIDLPGHGTRLGERCGYDEVIDVFDEAVDSAAPGQPVIVGGHSLGGYLAAMYADRLAADGRSGEIAGLALVGTTADPGSRLAVFYKWFAQILPKVGAQRMTAIANAMYRVLGTTRELPGPEAYEALVDSWALVFERCGPHLLGRLDCPVLLVNGQFDQMRIHVKQYAAQTTDVTTHLIKGATHVLPDTHSGELAAILNGFGRRLATVDTI